MIFLLNTRQTPIFLLGCIMEVSLIPSLVGSRLTSAQLPTFDLAISNLYPRVRNDLRFLSTFFFVRILFHALLLIDTARPANRAVVGDTWVPTILLFLAGVLHVSWFRGGLNGYLKRQRTAKKGRVADKSFNQPILDSAIKVDSSNVSHLPPTTTPEDSPLITPYTPSQTPMSLRDSYLFPSISMPTLSDLPTMSIPTFSDITAALPKSLNKDNLNFGFRDAVKTRWEEQRGMFVGMGARGRGMGLNLGGMSLRRRGAGSIMAGGEAIVAPKA